MIFIFQIYTCIFFTIDSDHVLYTHNNEQIEQNSYKYGKLNLKETPFSFSDTLILIFLYVLMYAQSV